MPRRPRPRGGAGPDRAGAFDVRRRPAALPPPRLRRFRRGGAAHRPWWADDPPPAGRPARGGPCSRPAGESAGPPPAHGGREELPDRAGRYARLEVATADDEDVPVQEKQRREVVPEGRLLPAFRMARSTSATGRVAVDDNAAAAVARRRGSGPPGRMRRAGWPPRPGRLSPSAPRVVPSGAGFGPAWPPSFLPRTEAAPPPRRGRAAHRRARPAGGAVRRHARPGSPSRHWHDPAAQSTAAEPSRRGLPHALWGPRRGDSPTRPASLHHLRGVR
jgi:hypothetical protein